MKNKRLSEAEERARDARDLQILDAVIIDGADPDDVADLLGIKAAEVRKLVNDRNAQDDGGEG